MVLKQLSKVVVQFSPWTGTARSAREFLARISAPKARASNPDCAVIHRLRVEGDPFVEVHYSNNVVERINTAELTVERIQDAINSKTMEMETQQRLSAAGLAGQQLESWFGDGVSDAGRETGKATKIPIQ